jgi:hypothetical protein
MMSLYYAISNRELTLTSSPLVARSSGPRRFAEAITRGNFNGLTLINGKCSRLFRRDVHLFSGFFSCATRDSRPVRMTSSDSCRFASFVSQ